MPGKGQPESGKPARLSNVIATEVVLPSHTNPLGTIFGGQIMAWIDIAASVSASRHARTICVTASLDTLHFAAPVKLGDTVCIYACVNYAHRTSMEIGVRVEAEDPRTGERQYVAKAYLTFVAVDEKGRPQPVPPLIPETPDEKRRFKEAQTRRNARLALKAELLKQRNGPR